MLPPSVVAMMALVSSAILRLELAHVAAWRTCPAEEGGGICPDGNTCCPTNIKGISSCITALEGSQPHNGTSVCCVDNGMGVTGCGPQYQCASTVDNGMLEATIHMKLRLLLFRKIADSNVQVNSETFIHLFAARRLATAASAEESKIGRRVQKSKKIKRPLRIDVKRHVSVAHAISKFYRIDCLARASQAKTTSCFRLYSMTPSTHSMTMSTALLCRLSWPTQMTVGTLE